MSQAATHAETTETDVQAWVGRTQERRGALTPELAGMVGAAVGHPRSAPFDIRPGAPIPYLWHWAAFPEFVPLSELGPDGHPALGKFLPPLEFSRRMWAAGRLTFSGSLRIAEALHRQSEILSITEKTGATGPMVFVRVGHTIEGAHGGRIEEAQDIVYLDIPDRFQPPAAIPVPEDTDFDESVAIDEARLFRYSAATANAHRIHYDLPYARNVEKYPDLVVQGPLQATLLIEAACRHTGARPARFAFRGVHPMFNDGPLRLLGTGQAGEQAIDLCTGAAAGHQGLKATMEWD
ncbi:MaoC family dehydratase N-terminal domain-containing protein [Pelagibius sp.]|uniref:FAS1-like dehydratase domain-containing protein n=1 Tax=Pelagibius sp. TaxID=1931238 RepID=UPI002629B2BA|nr:MaoC family dehydratase N-terminal domain-containing protein [Pelagibius sp.]